MFDMINNLILGVLTAMAEEERKKERKNIRTKQRQGIDAMVVNYYFLPKEQMERLNKETLKGILEGI